MVVEHASRGRDHLDRRADAVAIALCAPQIEHDPVIAVQRVIHQDARLLAQRSHNQIQESIVVQIDKCGSALIADESEIRAHLRRDILQGLSIEIPETSRRAASMSYGQIIDISIGRVDVLPAVVVVVDEANAPAAQVARQRAKLRTPGDIRKGFSVFVVEQAENLAGQIVIDNVNPAVVVEVACASDPIPETLSPWEL